MVSLIGLDCKDSLPPNPLFRSTTKEKAFIIIKTHVAINMPHHEVEGVFARFLLAKLKTNCDSGVAEVGTVYSIIASFLAYVAEDLEHSPLLQNGLLFLLKDVSFEEKWLQYLFPSDQRHEVTEHILQVIESQKLQIGEARVELMMRLYRCLQKQNYLANHSEALSIALFSAFHPQLFGYFAKWRYALPRSVLCDRQYVFLHPKKGQDIYFEDGRSKKVAESLAVPFDSQLPVQQVAWYVNRICQQGSEMLFSLGEAERGCDIMRTEFQLQSELAHLEPRGVGILPIIFTSNYTTEREHVCYPRIVAIGPLGKTLDMVDVVSEKIFFEIALQISIGLAKLQDQDKIHGDLKLRNIICLQGAVYINDFGKSFKRTELQGRFPLGFYGHRESTPPELLGCTNFSGDFKALEIWVLGCILYNILLKKSLPWESVLSKYFIEIQNRTKPVSEDDKAEVLKRIEGFEGQVGQSQAENFVRSLLRRAPENRPDIHTIIRTIRKTQEN